MKNIIKVVLNFNFKKLMSLETPVKSIDAEDQKK